MLDQSSRSESRQLPLQSPLVPSPSSLVRPASLSVSILACCVGDGRCAAVETCLREDSDIHHTQLRLGYHHPARVSIRTIPVESVAEQLTD